MAPSSRDRLSVDLHGLKAALCERAQALADGTHAGHCTLTLDVSPREPERQRLVEARLTRGPIEEADDLFIPRFRVSVIKWLVVQLVDIPT
jgi:hypothetical protein